MGLPMEVVDDLFDYVLTQMPLFGVAVDYVGGEFSARLIAPGSGKRLWLGEVDIEEDDSSELVVNHTQRPQRKDPHQSNVTIDISDRDAAVRAVLGELGMARGTEPRAIVGE